MTVERYPPLLVDEHTGDQFVLVDHFHHYVKTECGESRITRIELIRRMRAVGWEFEYMEATNPDPPHDVIGLDLFRIPAGWEGEP
jgi:hypothetical protein